MADHSPAARAIVAAFNDRYELCGPCDDDWPELCLAAALRALTDPVLCRPEIPDDEYNLLMKLLDREVRSIATELES